MTQDALIHLRVPAATKARWVRESRAAGMRLTDWIVSKVEAQPMHKITPISIPQGMTFADLRLARDPQTGDVSFDTAIIERIERESGLPTGFFMGQHEDAVASLITGWYSAHRAAGACMTPSAFEALVKLLRMTGAASIEAARLVLVEGRTQAEAVKATGLSRAGVSQAVKACRAGIELAKKVTQDDAQQPEKVV